VVSQPQSTAFSKNTTIAKFGELSLHASLATFIIIAFNVCAFGDESVWSHNGSTIRWVSDGNKRTAYYLAPRAGLNVETGQILFEGERRGDDIKGTAYTFKVGCPPAPFKVAGKVTNEHEILLEGVQPVRASGCKATSTESAALTFDYVRSGTGQAPDENAAASASQEAHIRNDNTGRAGFDPDATASTCTIMKATIEALKANDYGKLSGEPLENYMGTLKYVLKTTIPPFRTCSYERDDQKFQEVFCSAESSSVLEANTDKKTLETIVEGCFPKWINDVDKSDPTLTLYTYLDDAMVGLGAGKNDKGPADYSINISRTFAHH
jgi:hypothetical protein